MICIVTLSLSVTTIVSDQALTRFDPTVYCGAVVCCDVMYCSLLVFKLLRPFLFPSSSHFPYFSPSIFYLSSLSLFPLPSLYPFSNLFSTPILSLSLYGTSLSLSPSLTLFRSLCCHIRTERRALECI